MPNKYDPEYAKSEVYKNYQRLYRKALVLLKKNHPAEFHQILNKLRFNAEQEPSGAVGFDST